MVSSETLRSVIDAGRAGKRLDELSTARVIAKVAHQVHAAQQKAGAGKAVGPLSPARVAIAKSGEVSLDLADAPPALGYSAPEQVSGGSGDRKSDVFSLGVVLWEALTHQRLFEAMNDAAVKAAVQERAITSPTEINANIPAELSAICMRALSRNATDRYQSLKAMAVEIEEFLDEAGYADNDTKIAQYLAQLTPLAVPAGSKPTETLQGPGPSTLVPPAKQELPRPKSASSSGALLAEKLANAATTSPPPSIASAPTVEVAAVTPLPPVLPSGSDAALKTPAAEPKKPVDDIKATIVESTPVALINAAEDAMKAAAAMKAAEALPVAKTETATPAADAKPIDAKPADAKPSDAKPADAKPADAKPADDAVPAKQGTRETGPHPASVVSLPGRDSKADVLAGWGWGTDKHDALPANYEDDSDFEQPRSSKKILTYVLGGGLAVALLVTVIAFAAGGSAKKDTQRELARQNQEAVAKELQTTQAVTPAPVETGSGSAAAMGSDVATGSGSDVAAGSAVAANGSSDGSAQALSAADQAAADKAAADQAAADKAAADKAAADKATADKAAADKAAADKAAADAAAKKQAAADKAAADAAAKKQAAADAAAKKQAPADEAARKKAEAKKAADEVAAKKAEEKRLAREEAARKKAEAAKTTTAKTDTKKRADKATTTTKTVAAADVKKTDANGKPIEAETAYRQGLQAFARGDNAGAISSLRTSLAVNPNYAPTYRGLGLVYEKMGEKDAAKVAYKKYLQLAPTAGDAEIIRGRLERLGT